MKLLIKISSLVLAFLVFHVPTEAQQIQGLTEADLILTPTELLEGDLDYGSNNTFVRQVGNNNTADIIQQKQDGAKINLVKVLQSGDFNQTFILQSGSGNQTAVVQNGVNNFYDLEIVGNENKLAVIQDGDRNRIVQDISNTNELKIEVIQQGNDNSVIQNLNENNAQEFKILQRGNGLRAIITQEGSN